jgi:hypothetical protein
MAAPFLVVQTTYAELLERGESAAFGEAFPEDGTFTPKTINGRRYWYFQVSSAEGRAQRYVGPETKQLLDSITRHKQARDDQRERRALVSTLTRSFRMPAPIPQIGDIVSALAGAGIFRRRSVLVGTVAYQCYPAMLGIRLPNALLQTGDVDIAQSTNVSVAVGDQTRPMLQVLKDVDKTFLEFPHTSGRRSVTSYAARGGLRVDFETPNEGPDTDDPQTLQALQTNAQPLRFLDFLIHDPVPAVLLHGTGVYVQVPAPERYAVHKLILAQRRPAGVAKRDKDLQQAAALTEILAVNRPAELKLAWEEALERGPAWRELLLDGMSRLASRPRDLTLKIVGRARALLPGIDLTFNNPPAHYDFDRDIVVFKGEALGSPVACSVSREVLEDHFNADNLDKAGRVGVFLRNRSKIEQLIRTKYLTWLVEEPDAVLLKTMDVEKLA